MSAILSLPKDAVPAKITASTAYNSLQTNHCDGDVPDGIWLWHQRC